MLLFLYSNVKGEKRSGALPFFKKHLPCLKEEVSQYMLKGFEPSCVYVLNLYVFQAWRRGGKIKHNPYTVFVTLIYVFSLLFYVKQTKSQSLKPSWPSEQDLKQCANVFLSWLFLLCPGYWFWMASKSFWHFSDYSSKVLMTEEETNGTDQLFISGLICIYV